MLPVRARCNTCGNYMSEGTKFNCREEHVLGEDYLGIKVHRFYIKCTKCSAELTIKTDPKKSGYTAESGVTCTYNGHKEEEKEKQENALESLERRTKVSKREIEVMATLGEMKSIKSRRASVSLESMLEALSRRKKQEEDKEEEEVLIKSIKFGKRTRLVESFDHEKKPKRRDCGKSTIQISSSFLITSKKTAKQLPMELESLAHNYGSDSDEDDTTGYEKE